MERLAGVMQDRRAQPGLIEVNAKARAPDGDVFEPIQVGIGRDVVVLLALIAFHGAQVNEAGLLDGIVAFFNLRKVAGNEITSHGTAQAYTERFHSIRRDARAGRARKISDRAVQRAGSNDQKAVLRTHSRKTVNRRVQVARKIRSRLRAHVERRAGVFLDSEYGRQRHTLEMLHQRVDVIA